MDQNEPKEAESGSVAMTPKTSAITGPNRVSHMIGGNALSQLRALIATPPPAQPENEKD